MVDSIIQEGELEKLVGAFEKAKGQQKEKSSKTLYLNLLKGSTSTESIQLFGKLKQALHKDTSTINRNDIEYFASFLKAMITGKLTDNKNHIVK